MLKILFYPLKIISRFLYKQYLFIKIQSSNYDRRFEAVYALHKKYGDKAIPGLIEILRHKDDEIRHDAAYTLELITGKYNGENHKKWARWWKNNKKKIKKN